MNSRKAKPNTVNQQTLSPLPSRERLATLACLTGQKSAKVAVRQALGIWREADRVLEEEKEATFKDIPHPESFPATLRDFLNLVVKGKNRSIKLARFRRYLEQQDGLNDLYMVDDDGKPVESDYKQRAAGVLNAYQEDGISKAEWRTLAFGYRSWWRKRLSESNQQSALKRRI